MYQTGIFNPHFDIEKSGLSGLAAVTYNLEAPALVELAVARGEGRLARGGALVAETGVHTGRSPKDKFIVRD